MVKNGRKSIFSKRGQDPFKIQTGRFGKGRPDTIYRPDWSEDTYIADNQDKETVGKSFDLEKVPYILGFLCLLMCLLIGKTAWLQVLKSDYYYSMAEDNRIRIERLEPRRGVIYDRNGETIVRNKPNFMLYIVPSDLPEDSEETGLILAEIEASLKDISADEIKGKLAAIPVKSLESYQPLFLKDKISYEVAMDLYLKSSAWPGVVLTNKTNREYLAFALDDGPQFTSYSLSHIIGYTGKINSDELKKFGEEYLSIDYIGKMGIEYFWENELKGKSGKKQIEVDALGKEKKLIGKIDPVDGHNLVLSLDLMQQIKLEEILNAHLKKAGKTKATAIILDPNNGEILAMVCLPAYDNNVFARGISAEEYEALVKHPDNPLFNRCISGEYPSGSTVKPVISAAALEEGVITEKTSFNSVGGIRIGQWFFPDWLAGGHGLVDVRTAIAVSANTFFYYIGGGYQDFSGLGVDRIVEYGKLFGLGSQTGIDLAGEKSGFLPTREWKEETKGERWYIGDTYHLAIGQGDLLVTPLQVAVYTGVFANGGSLYRPHLAKAVLGGDDKFISETELEPIRKDFISHYNIEVVRQGMRKTVTSGSARSLQTLPIEVAGKTGTAQWSSKNENHAWFTGFAPYDNPELVVTIMVEEGGEGSAMATPIAREYLDWYFREYKKIDSAQD